MQGKGKVCICISVSVAWSHYKYFYSSLHGMLVHQMVTPNIKFTNTHSYMYIWVEFTQPILWSLIPMEIYIELQGVYDSAVLFLNV